MKPVLFAILVSALLASGCDEKKARLEHEKTEQFSEGVRLVGCLESNTEKTFGILSNGNPFSVRIREVKQYRGEMTRKIFVLPSGKTIRLDSLSPVSGFYIYTMDGVMIGWISFSCPKS